MGLPPWYNDRLRNRLARVRVLAELLDALADERQHAHVLPLWGLLLGRLENALNLP